MKKNLKIVSAAAAALLAVAPVAASAVVMADPVQNATDIGTVPALTNGAKVNVTPNITLNTSAGKGIKAALSVSFNATVDGTTATSNFTPNVSNIDLYEEKGNVDKKITDLQQVTSSEAGAKFRVVMTHVGLNFGTKNANKDITLTFPKNDGFRLAHNNSFTNSRTIKLDKNGTVTLNEVVLSVTAKDFANPAIVSWHDRATGANVSAGHVTVDAGSDAGRMNVAQIVSLVEDKYVAGNWAKPESSTISYSNNISDALKAMGVTVDSNGWFTAPKSFTFNMTAQANNNDAKAVLPVTVNVPNGKDVSNPSEYDYTVRVWNKKESYIYNSNHQRLANGMRYKIGSGHNVVAENGAPKEYHVGGIVAYKLADGHYKGNYVDVRNFSTSRVNSNVKVVTTRSRVFSASGRVIGKHNYVNAGVRVRVRGTKTIRGHKMYRIATNRYIKAANVRQA